MVRDNPLKITSLANKADSLTMLISSLEEHVAAMRRDLALLHGDMARVWVA